MDLFGYTRTNNSTNQMMSAEFAVVSVNGGQVSLVQSLQATYSQEVRPIFEVGSPSLYWVTGHAQGTVALQRIAGGTKFFGAFGVSGNCGRISGITVSARGGQACASGGGSGGVARFNDGILSQVELRMQAGQVEIMEGATFRVSSLES